MTNVDHSTQRVLFVQGGGEGAHAADARLVASLRAQLGSSYAVHYPVMPKEDEPNYATWRRSIAEELARIGDGAVVVAHSVGAAVLIKGLADGGFEQSIAAVFLIAAPFLHDDEVWRWQEAALPRNVAERLPRGLPLFLYHGREDEVVPFAHFAMYRRALPHATFRALDGRDHQVNEDLTEVADDIKRSSEQVRR